MQSPPLDPNVADFAPAEPALTPYDHEHVLHIDPDQDVGRARRAFDSHLARAKWMTRHGYRHLLRNGWPSKN